MSLRPAARRIALALAFASALQEACSAYVYKYPDPQYEAWDHLLYTTRLSAVVEGCIHRGGGEGNFSTEAAEWLRFAYHDMSTHNTDAGTGGLDASIHFELDRPENKGTGMTDTQIDYEQMSNKLLTKADVIAAGAIHGVAVCGGPSIPFRGGRKDASAPGPEGVPQPEELLDAHTEKFRLQGFNATEMIALVACGHTMGSVRSVDFPEVVSPPVGVPNDADNTVLDFFDTTPDVLDVYDEKVVTRYLDGSTKNPLVAGPNVTTRSDLRIFLSDGNVTMLSMSTLDSYKERCQSLLERMLNTVPTGSKLAEDPLEIIPEKVEETRFVFINETTFGFRTSLRLTGKSTPPNRTVKLCWCDRYGPAKDCSQKTAHCANRGGAPFSSRKPSSYAKNQGFTGMDWHQFAVVIDSALSVSQFWFVMDDQDGSGQRKLVNTDGGRFPMVQDEVVFWYMPHPNPRVSTYDLAVGVRNALTVTTSSIRSFLDTPFTHKDDTFPCHLNSTLPAIAGYKFYSPETQIWALLGQVYDVNVDLEDANGSLRRVAILDEPEARAYIRSPLPVLSTSVEDVVID